MKLVMAKQHGAWAMLLIPFLLGVFIGVPKFVHIPLFFAWFFLYLATYPFLQALKKRKTAYYLKWFFIYFIPMIIFLIYPLLVDYKLIYFGLAMIPFFFINVYFSKTRNERALLNDIVAIFVFGIGGLASYYFGVGKIDHIAIAIFIYCFLYFLGSTFYVKTMIREKKNIYYKYVSWGYHIGLLIVLALFGQFPFLLAFIPSTIRAIVFYGKKLPIKKLGIYEIINATYFFIVMLIIFQFFF